MKDIKEVSVEELHKKLGKVNLIEIRESCEINGGKIPTSEIILAIGIYMNHSFMLDKQKEYYVACLNEAQGYKVVKFLIENGYEITNIKGGTMEYAKHFSLEYTKS